MSDSRRGKFRLDHGLWFAKRLSYFEVLLVRNVSTTYTRLTAVDGSGERFPRSPQKRTLADFRSRICVSSSWQLGQIGVGVVYADD